MVTKILAPRDFTSEASFFMARGDFQSFKERMLLKLSRRWVSVSFCVIEPNVGDDSGEYSGSTQVLFSRAVCPASSMWPGPLTELYTINTCGMKG